MSVLQACFSWGQWFQNGYSGSMDNGLLLPGNTMTLVCWSGLFSSRVWLYGTLCLRDVVQELQADVSTSGRPRLGQDDMFICGWSCGLADINSFSGNRSWEGSVASGRLWKDTGELAPIEPFQLSILGSLLVSCPEVRPGLGPTRDLFIPM